MTEKMTKLTMGKWIIVDDTEYFIARCSECGKAVDSRRLNKFLFCPKCKAKMKNTGGLKMAEDRIEVTHLMGKKLDKPIIMKWKSESKNNKIEKIAALFGKKLGEEFRVRRHYYLSCSTVKAKFIDKGFQILYDGGDYWTYSPDSLVDLLIGKAVIVDD